MARGTAYTIMTIYIVSGCHLKDKVIRKLSTPDWTPPAPSPAMARPTINATELGAAPQMADPTSNSTTAVRNTVLTENNVYSLPKTSRKAQLVRRYAVPYQPMSLVEEKSFVIWATAVEMMSLS